MGLASRVYRGLGFGVFFCLALRVQGSGRKAPLNVKHFLDEYGQSQYSAAVVLVQLL